jgi:hypothetical protein
MAVNRHGVLRRQPQRCRGLAVLPAIVVWRGCHRRYVLAAPAGACLLSASTDLGAVVGAPTPPTVPLTGLTLDWHHVRRAQAMSLPS